jgi:hypothetical protein
MISFLRLIRKKLVKKRRLTQYTLYAIGEVTLIVVGIGIAISANNYVEKQKNLKQSNFFLNGMLEDLASDTVQLDRVLKQLSVQLDLEQWLLNKKTFSSENLDSIKLASRSLKWSFTINDRSFQNIQNASGSKLFGYDSLYSDISQYYLVMGNRIKQNNDLEALKSMKVNPFTTLVHENIFLETREYQDYAGFGVKIKGENSKDSEENINYVMEHLSDINIQNSLNDKFTRHNYLFISLTFCNKEAKSLAKKINQALESTSN